LIGQLGRDEPHVAADRDHVGDAIERYLEADFLDHIRDVALEQRHLQLLGMAAQVELLAEANRAEGVHTRAGGLSPAEQRQAGAAAADFDQQRAR